MISTRKNHVQSISLVEGRRARFLSDASSLSKVSSTSSRLRFGDERKAGDAVGIGVGTRGGGRKIPGPGAVNGVRSNHDKW